MAQTEGRKYGLFPQSVSIVGKGLDPGKASVHAIGQNADSKTEKPSSGGLRARVKENTLTRRRKVSVPELGPMTTVHEASMDSPTLPGRLAFHERSASAPGGGWKLPHLTYRNDSSQATVPKPPPSPKDLPPLMIPAAAASSLKRKASLGRLRSGSNGTTGSNNSDHPIPRSVPRPEDSPRTRTPYTPSTTAATTPLSATMTTSTLPTPVSATIDTRVSPNFSKPGSALETPIEEANEAPDTASTSAMSTEPRSTSSASNHSRTMSDAASTNGSIMDRGRPKKRSETGLSRSGSKKSKSAERRAFETLPKGWKVMDAVPMLSPTETAALKKQAVQQAARFEILRKTDVDSLSRELRNLDERCEYLRRTYHSLRAGRRNLHSRICQYLRSPRMVKFSQDSLLKQEEALAELDASIDDWVHKLEQAENRRTRVRQKLLEHVAAALTLPGLGGLGQGEVITSPTFPTNISTPPRSPTRDPQSPKSTPPTSSSPPRTGAQVPSTIIEQPLVEEAAAIGLGIDHFGPQAADKSADEPLTAGIRRAEVESIRIYAGDEVAALLADVEQQITHMSKACDQHTAIREKQAAAAAAAAVVKDLPKLSDRQRKQLHRAQSHEALQGSLKSVPSTHSLKNAGHAAERKSPTTERKSPTSSTPRSTTPTIAELKAEDAADFILPSAVFKPT